MKQNETALVKTILDYLRLRGCMVWRQNAGAVSGEYKGKKRFVRFAGISGISDIIGLTKQGRFLAVECKMPKGSPTLAQAEFLTAVRASGGIAIVARCIEDVEEALRQ